MSSVTLHGAREDGHAVTTPDFGDVRAELRALLSGSGVYDLGWRAKIALTGSDRVRWLNGMISNNVRDLAPGHGVYAFLLNSQGRIQADLYAFNRGESLMVDCGGDEYSPRADRNIDRVPLFDFDLSGIEFSIFYEDRARNLWGTPTGFLYKLA